MADTTTLGVDFAQALAAKDTSRLLDLLHPEVDFRGLTPSRAWEEHDAEAVVRMLVGQWLEADDEVTELGDIETGTVADRERVGYRMNVRNPDGDFVFEQQAYLSGEDGRIGWMRVVCSGFRPLGEA